MNGFCGCYSFRVVVRDSRLSWSLGPAAGFPLAGAATRTEPATSTRADNPERLAGPVLAIRGK